MFLSQEHIDLLDRCVDGGWKYENGVINVKGNVYLTKRDLTLIPFQFGEVAVDFFCQDNNLVSLKGSPYKVGRCFFCYNNKLTSLKYVPEIIGEKIDFYSNPFIFNDKLFEDIARLRKSRISIRDYDTFLNNIKQQISIQFGITDEYTIEDIWYSYIKILQEIN